METGGPAGTAHASWTSDGSAVCGPGVIVLGVSIGSGEFLLGPATFVKHGLSLLWVTLVAVFFQTIFNTELMRYTVATGEPVVTGFMRTPAGKTFWAWFYALLYFLQVGWPAWAATAAGAIFFVFLGRLATPPADAQTIYLIGIATFLACVVVLLLGKRIARTLELLNWVLVTVILGGFLVLALIYVPAATWGSALVGILRLRHGAAAASAFCPSISTSCCWARWSAIRAVAAFSTSRCRTGRATRATAWAAASATSAARWAASAARLAAHRVHVRGRRRKTWSAGAAGGASCASTSGAFSSSARCSA